jgi:DNA-binding GntR family transcriptional regulator
MASGAKRRSKTIPTSPFKTIPERIADEIGEAIGRGEYADGDRLGEQELSERFGVSRGPVREALRILAQRDMAIIYPRRGAFVTGVSLDSLVDLFNIRAVFMGLAARYFAAMAADDDRVALDGDLARLEAASRVDDIDPREFVRRTGRVGVTIARGCGSPALRRIIEHQNQSSAWTYLWNSGRLDFTTRERRLAVTANYLEMGAAIAERDGQLAEAVMRKMIMVARENAISALAAARGETYDERRLLLA